MFSSESAPSAPRQHYLLPGALYVGQGPAQVDTVLGSCVSVCLWDATLRVGGINHYMLPLWNGQGLASPKFGNIAIRRLLERLEALGARPETLIAKLFGGAHQFAPAPGTVTVGEKNVRLALESMEMLGIPVQAISAGGDRGRRIRFNVQTGVVGLKFLGAGQLQPA